MRRNLIAFCLVLATISTQVFASSMVQWKEVSPVPMPELPIYNAALESEFLPDNGPYIVHIWATWCGPCKIELPELDEFAHDRPNLPVIAIALDGTNTRKVRAFYDKASIKHLPILLDPNMDSMKILAAKTVPASFMVDEHNFIVARADGPVNWHGLGTRILLTSIGLVTNKSGQVTFGNKAP